MADNKKRKQTVAKNNLIESLKDIGTGASDEFFKELIGLQQPQVNRSGEMAPGESLKMSQVLSGKEEDNKKLRTQISFERNLFSEEKRLSENKMHELRVQLQAIVVEINKLAESTGSLAAQTEIAAIQAPINPGIYHVIFFEKVLEFLRSFRKKIDQASVWLGAVNKRAEKKNYWSMYKKKGSSFLLSPDHYSQRSAG